MISQKPFCIFKRWFNKAKSIKQIKYHNAFNLATVSKYGQPSNRMLLLKEWNETGFVFYTNLISSKALEIKENKKVSMCFYWDALGFQIRIEGICKQISDDKADTYFNSRAIESQIGAYVSKQSKPLKNYSYLLKCVAEETFKFKNIKIKRPIFWSGFKVNPHRIEFMEMKDYRLHKRYEFKLICNKWIKSYLYP